MIFAAMLAAAVIFASVLAVAMEAWVIAAESRDAGTQSPGQSQP